MKNEKEYDTGNTCLVAGFGIGALGVTGAVTAGAVCPLCVIATPALLGIGAFQKLRYSKNKNQLKTKEASEDDR